MIFIFLWSKSQTRNFSKNYNSSFGLKTLIFSFLPLIETLPIGLNIYSRFVLDNTFSLTIRFVLYSLAMKRYISGELIIEDTKHVGL